MTKATEWTSWSVRTEPMGPGETHAACVSPCAVFKVRWVIVTTPGFRIRIARVGNVAFVEESATDLYYVRNWDHLASIGQVERVRVSSRTGEVGNTISVEVTNENQFGRHRFECGFVGEQLVDTGWVRSGHDPFSDDLASQIANYDFSAPNGIGNPLVLPAIGTLVGDGELRFTLQPVERECPECGAPAGVGCLGVKRGVFHKRREKDKHR